MTTTAHAAPMNTTRAVSKTPRRSAEAHLRVTGALETQYRRKQLLAAVAISAFLGVLGLAVLTAPGANSEEGIAAPTPAHAELVLSQGKELGGYVATENGIFLEGVDVNQSVLDGRQLVDAPGSLEPTTDHSVTGDLGDLPVMSERELAAEFTDIDARP